MSGMQTRWFEILAVLIAGCLFSGCIRPVASSITATPGAEKPSAPPSFTSAPAAPAPATPTVAVVSSASAPAPSVMSSPTSVARSLPNELPSRTPLPAETLIAPASPTPAVALSKHGVSGRLKGPNGPVEALVALTYFSNESCARLREGLGHGSTRKLSKDEQQQLSECSRDAGQVHSDNQGRYTYVNLAPGWYWLVVAWQYDTTPDASELGKLEQRDGFLTTKLFWEGPNVYLAVAELEKPFYFDGSKDVVLNYDYNQLAGK